METDTVTFGFIYSEKKQQLSYQNMINEFSKLSSKHNKKMILFTLNHLDLDEQVVYGTLIEGERISQGLSAIPPYIYNLSLHTNIRHIDKMRSLRKMENTLIINPINRFIQAIIFEMLTSNTDFQPFILPTVSLNTSTLIDYLNKYDTFFLLPEKTFHPPKAVMVKKLPKNNFMIFIGQNGQRCVEEEIVPYIKKMINRKRYILLKGIELSKKGNDFLEAKVYLQKNLDGKWSITTISSLHGIFNRSEYSYSKLSNPLIQLNKNEITENGEMLANLSIQMARFLDYYIPFVGSFTFDFVFDKNRNPYIIYVSGFEQDQNFFKYLDSETQKLLLKNTFYYLLFQMNNDLTEKGAVI